MANVMQIQPLAGDSLPFLSVSDHFFAKQTKAGEKGVDASGSDPHNSPAQLNRVLLNGEECWLCSSVG